MSIRKTKAGTYAASIRLGKATAGETKDPRKQKTFARLKDAVAWVESIRTQIREGDYTPPTQWTVKEISEPWLDQKKALRALQTYKQCERHIRRYIEPAFGLRRMSDLTFVEIQDAGDRWIKEKKINPETCNKVYGSLQNLYEYARKYGVKNNPMRYVERKKAEKNEDEMEKQAREQAGEIFDRGERDEEANTLRAISADEVYSALELKQLIDASEPGLERIRNKLAIFTGVRHGELNALRWPVIDLKKNRLFVCRSLTEVKGSRILEKPKTKAAYRYIPFTDDLAYELKVWKLQCPPSPNGLVLVDTHGRPMNRKSNNTALQAAMRRAGIRVLSMNNLRHSFATQLLNAGVPLLEVSYLLGHIDASTTFKVYARWSNRERSTSAQTLATRILHADAPAEASAE